MWVTLAATFLMIAAMVRGRPADLVMLGGTVAFLTLGVLTPAEALAGFSNEGVVTVGVLFVVAAGIRQTGGLDAILRSMLGSPESMGAAQLRMMLPVSFVSAFINNTPVVAIVLPVVVDWARRVRLSPSKLLMPLSFATILGGTCTLIGTSTNLVVSGLAAAHESPIDFGFFDIARLGLPVLVAGLIYIVIASGTLLPSRDDDSRSQVNPREYMVAMRVEPDSSVVGRTVEQAGLRNLPGLFLVELQRDGEIIPAVGPTTRLASGDQLLFAGIVDSVVDLRKVRGLVPATGQLHKLVAPRPERRLVEVVVAARSPLAGMSIRETRFRTQFDAAIIAVHRGSERLRAKLGDIVLRPGDVLLVETSPAFVRKHEHDRSFALLREVEGSAPPRHERAWLAATIVLSMIVVSATGLLPLLTSALLAASALLATRCLTTSQALASVEARVLLTIATSFAVGAAIEKTGLAHLLANALVNVSRPFGAPGIVAGLYVCTALLSSVVTNNSAAALMFPLCTAAAASANIPLKPTLLALMMAASASFATPIGYQTNLMVYGPGRYRFSDFMRFGLPLQFVAGVVTLVMVTSLWLQ